jgi:hypothetical protein
LAMQLMRTSNYKVEKVKINYKDKSHRTVI